nr:hypothetical protein [Tanacetum cinerariifolium]
DWTSNANLCSKGCRIILGWNTDVVNTMVLSQSSQIMHVKIIHKATNDIMFFSFIYASNSPVERRFQHGFEFGGLFFGPSCVNSAMTDFKVCVMKIEVMDINSMGLHYTWNQKPKGRGGSSYVPGGHQDESVKKMLRKLLHSHGNLHDRVNALRIELDKVQTSLDCSHMDSNLHEKEATYLNAFNEAKLDEEHFLKQKAKIECISNEEIKSAMFDIEDDRAPGPDGYTSTFFKKSWDLVENDICIAVRDFFNNGQLLKEISHAFLTLIPKYLSPRDIFGEGFNLQTCVADLVSNEGWLWPQSWLRKAPNLGLIMVPNLDENQIDLPQWRDLNGAFLVFSVRGAWEDLRPRGIEVSWYHVVWFSHNIPRHDFHLCGIHMDIYSLSVLFISHMDVNSTSSWRIAKSVIGRILVAATSYFIWVERNNLIFKNVRRTPKEIRDIIMVTVRLKLLTFRFKNAAMVNEYLSR